MDPLVFGLLAEKLLALLIKVVKFYSFLVAGF